MPVSLHDEPGWGWGGVRIRSVKRVEISRSVRGIAKHHALSRARRDNVYAVDTDTTGLQPGDGAVFVANDDNN